MYVYLIANYLIKSCLKNSDYQKLYTEASASSLESLEKEANNCENSRDQNTVCRTTSNITHGIFLTVNLIFIALSIFVSLITEFQYIAVDVFIFLNCCQLIINALSLFGIYKTSRRMKMITFYFSLTCSIYTIIICCLYTKFIFKNKEDMLDIIERGFKLLGCNGVITDMTYLFIIAGTFVWIFTYMSCQVICLYLISKSSNYNCCIFKIKSQENNEKMKI